MTIVSGVSLVLPPDYVNAAAVVSLLSVLVLIALFFYLNIYTGRRYFSIWTVGWIFYAVWLGMGPGIISVSPFQVMIKHWCVGMSAALLLWGSAQFLRAPSRPMLFGLFMGFLLIWSYFGAYHLKDPLQIRLPIFGIIGLASLVAAFSFYRLRKHQEYIGAGLLTFGFLLWGVYLGVCPFFAGDNQMAGTSFLISAGLQLFIAVSMIILVLEEAKAANDLILSQIRAYHSERQGVESGLLREMAQYQGVFDQSSLSEKLRLAYGDLRQTQEKSLQQERLQALGQMSRGIAHDINNALTPVLGYANVMLRDSSELPEHVVKYVWGIKRGGEKIAESVSCIRDFYRNQEGREVLVPLNLNDLVAEAVETNREEWHGSLKSNGAQMIFRAGLDSNVGQIMGKKSELSEALSQLILNGIEAMPYGGVVELRTSVRRGTSKRPGASAGEEVLVEVVDTGLGMNEETRKRCLEPFFSTKDRQGAKGLGLSKVFGIVQRHRGQIEIESQEGRGTTMRLVFPAVQSGNTELLTLVRDGGAMRPLKILCIDDEPSVLDVVKLILKEGGHAVETASDGEGGLESFRAAQALSEPFDVVITDLGMPKLDGHQVARIIKRESAKTPVIMLTGWGGIMHAERNHPENVDVILSKPPQINELVGALRKVAPSA